MVNCAMCRKYRDPVMSVFHRDDTSAAVIHSKKKKKKKAQWTQQASALKQMFHVLGTLPCPHLRD